MKPTATVRIRKGMQKSRMCMRRNCILIYQAMDNVDSSMLGMKQCAMPRVDGRVVDVRGVDGKAPVHLVRRAMRCLLCGRDISGVGRYRSCLVWQLRQVSSEAPSGECNTML